ncbi:MAG TPA: hypothetical protein VEG26_05400 [Steroidobacteraceae bacterium]|nr:hypothetical protein [Steroidobacteraceae bacterium]
MTRVAEAEVRCGALRPLAAVLALCAAAAAAGGPAAPREYLDEQTAATVTVVGEPLVFALPRPELAANVRDYATLAAAAVNRAGKISYVLIAYFWSTVDARLRRDPLPAAEPLALQADDRRLALALEGHSAHDAGIGERVHAPPGSAAEPNVYRTDLATLRFIAAARRLTILAESKGAPLTYDLWQDRRPALQAFVRRMSGAD